MHSRSGDVTRFENEGFHGKPRLYRSLASIDAPTGTLRGRERSREHEHAGLQGRAHDLPRIHRETGTQRTNFLRAGHRDVAQPDRRPDHTNRQRSGPGDLWARLLLRRNAGRRTVHATSQAPIGRTGPVDQQPGFAGVVRRRRPITVPIGSSSFTIAAGGTISGNGGTIAKIGLSEFENPGELKRDANGLYEAGAQAAAAATESEINQGMLEQSNV